MTSCKSILFALFIPFYGSYSFNQSIETTQLATKQTHQPSVMQTDIPTLNVLNLYGECDNPAEAKFRHDYVSLSECIDLFEEVDCVMLQYYEKLQSNSDSRCYIFDQICDLSQNVGKRANFSHIYYKNQFTTNYCVDYRDWTDKYLDSCNAYVTHGLCLNGKMTEKATVQIFEQSADLIYNWNALEACCECGGGKYVFNDIAVTYVNKHNFNNGLQECSFKNDMLTTINLIKWNNFGLHQLIEGINYPLNSDLFIYKYLSNVNSTTLNASEIYICNFDSYDITSTSHDIYTDFFIFASIENIGEEEYTYFINSEYFDIDLSVISSVLAVGYYTYQECNNFIVNASLDDNADIDMILPCFVHQNYTSATEVSTETPEIEKVTEVTKVTVQVSQTPQNENNRIYVIMTVLSCILFLCVVIILFICLYRYRRKTEAEKLQKHQKFSENVQHAKRKSNDVSAIVDEMIITMVKTGDDDECKYETDEKEEIIEENKKGLLVFQEAWYNKEQMKNIYEKYKSVDSASLAQAPKMLFGDNDVDNKR
eukprot:485956_1